MSGNMPQSRNGQGEGPHQRKKVRTPAERRRRTWIIVLVVLLLGACVGILICMGTGLVEIGLGGSGPLAFLASKTPSKTPFPSSTPTLTGTPTMTPTATPTPRPTLGAGNIASLFPIGELTIDSGIFGDYGDYPSNEISCGTFSQDGRWLAGCYGNMIIVWDMHTGQSIYALQQSSEEVTAVAFSADSRQLAAANHGGTITIWDLDTKKATRNLVGHEGSVNCVAFSPDDRLLASGANDKTIILWSVQTGKSVNTLTGHPKQVEKVAFSPDGLYLASADHFGRAILWELDNATYVRNMPGENVIFSPDGKTLATLSKGNIIFWDVKQGFRVRTFYDRYYPGFAISPDWTLLITADPNDLLIWDIDTGERIHSVYNPNYSVTSMSFSPDGQLLLVDNVLWGVLASAP